MLRQPNPPKYALYLIGLTVLALCTLTHRYASDWLTKTSWIGWLSVIICTHQCLRAPAFNTADTTEKKASLILIIGIQLSLVATWIGLCAIKQQYYIQSNVHPLHLFIQSHAWKNGLFPWSFFIALSLVMHTLVHQKQGAGYFQQLNQSASTPHTTAWWAAPIVFLCLRTNTFIALCSTTASFILSAWFLGAKQMNFIWPHGYTLQTLILCFLLIIIANQKWFWRYFKKLISQQQSTAYMFTIGLAIIGLTIFILGVWFGYQKPMTLPPPIPPQPALISWQLLQKTWWLSWGWLYALSIARLCKNYTRYQMLAIQLVIPALLITIGTFMPNKIPTNHHNLNLIIGMIGSLFLFVYFFQRSQLALATQLQLKTGGVIPFRHPMKTLHGLLKITTLWLFIAMPSGFALISLGWSVINIAYLAMILFALVAGIWMQHPTDPAH